MRKKIIIAVCVIIVVVVTAIIAAIKLPVYFSDKTATNDSAEQPTVSENTVVLEKPTELEPPTEKEETNISEDGYVDFVYDPNESSDSYLSSKTSIQGSGTVIDNSSVSIQNGTSAVGGTDTTQQFWYSEAEKGKDYLYAVTDYEYSNGFGFVPSQKYSIRAEALIGDTIKLDAPNNTSMLLKELDSYKGDATYWREYYLNHFSFGKWESLTEVDTLQYNTKYILGTGLENWDKLNIYNEQDLTVNPYGKQLICDISVDTLFGEGYYFEIVDIDTGIFHGHMFIQHGDRVYYCDATSEYHKSLKDICTATVDRCITTY